MDVPTQIMLWECVYKPAMEASSHFTAKVAHSSVKTAMSTQQIFNPSDICMVAAVILSIFIVIGIGTLYITKKL